jgi:hypothetical protein
MLTNLINQYLLQTNQEGVGTSSSDSSSIISETLRRPHSNVLLQVR